MRVGVRMRMPGCVGYVCMCVCVCVCVCPVVWVPACLPSYLLAETCGGERGEERR
jgi:hypothetical protein